VHRVRRRPQLRPIHTTISIGGIPTARGRFGLIPAVAIPVRLRVSGRHGRRKGRAGSGTRTQCHRRIAQRPAWRIAMRVQRLRHRRAARHDSRSMAVIDSRQYRPGRQRHQADSHRDLVSRGGHRSRYAAREADASALSTCSGSFSIARISAFAGPVGSRRPCSQFRSVASSTCMS
jgi:hypothetical protein